MDGDEAYGFVGDRSAHIRLLLFLDGVHVHIVPARALADQHTLIRFHAWTDEKLAALLKVVEGIGSRSTRSIRHQRTGQAARDFALPLDVAFE